MRGGYSTGACAAAAAKAAALRASGVDPGGRVEIPFPDGSRARLACAWSRPFAAAVVKDAGDDPDLTNGSHVEVELEAAPEGCWRFEAGRGVGTVTRPGLQLPVGEPAINPGPRAMIRAALEEAGWRGARVRVAIPGGEVLAARTFNPRLGVLGGLSVLGTAGTVRPFSLEAVRATVACALDVARAAGHARVCLVPGHLGERALRALLPSAQPVVEVSNAWDTALDHAARLGFEALLLAGHPGKLAKLAEGHFDTHSASSPSPLPGLARRAAALGLPAAEVPTVEGLFQALDAPGRARLGRDLARDVAAAASARCGLPCGVLLTAMDASEYGRWTEGTPWA